MGLLDPQRHACMALHCVGRIEPLLTYFFGGTCRLPEVRQFPESVVRKQSLDLVDLGKAEALREFYEAKIGELYDEDEQGYPLNAFKVICGALAKAAPRDWDAPDDVVLFVVETVDGLAGCDKADLEAAFLHALVDQIVMATAIDVPKPLECKDEPEWLADFGFEHAISF